MLTGKKNLEKKNTKILLALYVYIWKWYACICANNMTPSNPIKVSRLVSQREREWMKKICTRTIKYSTAMYSIKIYFQEKKKKKWTRRTYTHTHIQTTNFFSFPLLWKCCPFRFQYFMCVCAREWRKFFHFFFPFFRSVYVKLCLTFFCRPHSHSRSLSAATNSSSYGIFTLYFNIFACI